MTLRIRILRMLAIVDYKFGRYESYNQWARNWGYLLEWDERSVAGTRREPAKRAKK